MPCSTTQLHVCVDDPSLRRQRSRERHGTTHRQQCLCVSMYRSMRACRNSERKPRAAWTETRQSCKRTNPREKTFALGQTQRDPSSLASDLYAICKSTCGWMVRGTVVFPAHQGSNPDARIYFWIYFRFFGNVHLVGGDVPVDDEVPMMTS